MRIFTQSTFCLLLLLAVDVVRAQDNQEDKAELTQEQKGARYLELFKEVTDDFAKKQYAAAEPKCIEMTALARRDPMASYNLACAQARLGKTEAALDSLEKAVKLGFSDSDHIRADADLESLHQEKRFDGAVSAAKDMQAEQFKKLYEKPAEIEGVKTVEREPEGGLRYYLRMSPEVTKDKPAKLVVWLHPSGGSGNRVAERMLKRLIANDYALLVPDQKQWSGWTEEELKRLTDKSLPDAGKVEGIDSARPILMGFSAGGQAALILWSADPSRFGGLVLDAAYPIRQGVDPKTGQRIQSLLSPPKAEAVKSVPIFVLVGENDQGSKGVEIWQKAVPEWQKAEVPLTLKSVPNKGHEWLFGSKEADDLEAWLKEIRQGRGKN